MKYIILVTLMFFGKVSAFPLAEFSGETTISGTEVVAEADQITEYLHFNVTGNLGSNSESEEAGVGYWIDSSETPRSTANTSISNSFTFTVTGLGENDTVDLTELSFDYVRTNLDNTGPVMDVYVDTGDGYGDSVLRVDGNPTGSFQLDAQEIVIFNSLRNGESITFGFSFADGRGASVRTHMIDNLVLEGTIDRESDVPGLDLNLNGVSDLWEYRYSASSLVQDEETKNLDEDGDGISNIEEAQAGTNPFDATSKFSLNFNRGVDHADELALPSILGKDYAIFGSDSLESDSWEALAIELEGSGGELVMDLATTDLNRYFYRAEVNDVDSDNDRLTRYEELNAVGFSDSDSHSDGGNSLDDYQRLKSVIQSANATEVDVTMSSSTVYETGAEPVLITFTRAGNRGDGFLDLETALFLKITDTTQVASNAADSADYKLLDENDNEIVNGIIEIPVGAASTTIRVVAQEDGQIESDEQLTLSLAEEDRDFDLWIGDEVETSSEAYIALSRAGHFLSQASMGGTPESISALANDIMELGYLPACESWIDAQLELPRESTVTADCYANQALFLGGNSTPSVNIQNFEIVWWGKMVQTREQFRHRMAFSLSQVFVTSAAFWANEERGNLWQSYTNYYDKLMDEAYSTHRELLSTISYDPFMGVYLSSAQNRKANTELGTSPDENYAREVMQLFSVGVYAQDQNGNTILDGNGERIENYTNEDITELAKVFTGLGLTDEDGVLANFDSPDSNRGTRYMHPMLMSAEHHEESAKTLLDGTILPAGQTGDKDISDSLDVLAAHPSTAPHLSRLLIKRLTSSNPSADYIGRVVEAWNGNGPYGTGEIGNFVSVFKAILLDDEARNNMIYDIDDTTDVVTIRTRSEVAGRIKEPILKWTQFYRFSQTLSGEDDGLLRFRPLTKRSSTDQTPDFGQIPMRAPSVFNYYDSDFSPSLGALADAEAETGLNLTSPESEILSPFVIKQFESFYEIVNQENPTSSFTYLVDNDPTVSINYSYMNYLYRKNQTVGDFIDDVNLWLCNGAISEPFKNSLTNLAAEDEGTLQEQFAKIISVIFNSSDFSVAY